MSKVFYFKAVVKVDINEEDWQEALSEYDEDEESIQESLTQDILGLYIHTGYGTGEIYDCEFEGEEVS